MKLFKVFGLKKAHPGTESAEQRQRIAAHMAGEEEFDRETEQDDHGLHEQESRRDQHYTSQEDLYSDMYEDEPAASLAWGQSARERQPLAGEDIPIKGRQETPKQKVRGIIKCQNVLSLIVQEGRHWLINDRVGT